MSGTEVIMTEEATVFFYDENTNKTNAFFEVHIIVKTLRYSTGVEYYDVTYKYKFHKEELIEPDDILHYMKVLHPFFKEESDGKRGVIIKKNRMIKEMVEFLLMSDERLATEIGMTTPQRYRLDIIHGLARMWD